MPRTAISTGSWSSKALVAAVLLTIVLSACADAGPKTAIGAMGGAAAGGLIGAAAGGGTEGIIGATRGKARNALIGTVCRLLPRSRTFIACSTRPRCREIADALGPYVGGEVQAVHGGNWQSPCRVVCGTHTSFGTSAPARHQLALASSIFTGRQETRNP